MFQEVLYKVQDNEVPGASVGKIVKGYLMAEFESSDPKKVAMAVIDLPTYKISIDAPMASVRKIQRVSAKEKEDTMEADKQLDREMSEALVEIFKDPGMESDWTEVRNRLYQKFEKKDVDRWLVERQASKTASLKKHALIDDMFSMVRVNLRRATAELEDLHKRLLSFQSQPLMENEKAIVDNTASVVNDMMATMNQTIAVVSPKPDGPVQEPVVAQRKQALLDYAQIPKSIPVEVVDQTYDHFDKMIKNRNPQEGIKNSVRAYLKMQKLVESAKDQDIESTASMIFSALQKRGSKKEADENLSEKAKQWIDNWESGQTDTDVAVAANHAFLDAQKKGDTKQKELLWEVARQLKSRNQANKETEADFGGENFLPDTRTTPNKLPQGNTIASIDDLMGSLNGFVDGSKSLSEAMSKIGTLSIPASIKLDDIYGFITKAWQVRDQKVPVKVAAQVPLDNTVVTINQKEMKSLCASCVKQMERFNQASLTVPRHKLAKYAAALHGAMDCPYFEKTAILKVAIKEGVCEHQDCKVGCAFKH